MKHHAPLEETIRTFEEAGFEPTVEHGGRHLKVRGGKLLAVVSNSPSDRRAALNARSVARRLVKGTDTKQAHFTKTFSPEIPKGEPKRARLLVEQRNAEIARQREERRRQAEVAQAAKIAEEHVHEEAQKTERPAKPISRIHDIRDHAGEEQRRLERIAAKQARDARQKLEAEQALAANIDQQFKNDLGKFRRHAHAYLKGCELKIRCLKTGKEPEPHESLREDIWKIFDSGVIGPEGARVGLIFYAACIFGAEAKAYRPMYMTAQEFKDINKDFKRIWRKYTKLFPDENKRPL